MIKPSDSDDPMSLAMDGTVVRFIEINYAYHAIVEHEVNGKKRRLYFRPEDIKPL